ncbi:MAG TPA: YdcF family protein, partial [Burkholderiales bacterium]
GGSPDGSRTTEAFVMKSVLEHDFKIPVHWVEGLSRNSDENARYSRQILQLAGVHSVYLVTHAWHMRRARLAFERAGLTVIPAPTRYATEYRGLALDFLPRAGALRDSSIFFHETLGLAWYRLQFLISSWSPQAGKGVL